MAVTKGTLPPGLPYLRLGQGPPLLMALGGSAEHSTLVGLGRRASLAQAARFAGRFTVYLIGRRPGLAAGSTMADLATDLATAIEDGIGEPAAVHGTSLGGSAALQLAIGHPHLVRRLVLVAAACRLSPRGRALLAEVARLVKAGNSRHASAVVAGALAPWPLRRPALALGWLANPLATDDPADMLIANAAAMAFDAEPELHQVRAPTLVLGGSADPYYTEYLFRRTAEKILRGRVVIFSGRGHVYSAISPAAAAIALNFLLEEQPRPGGW